MLFRNTHARSSAVIDKSWIITSVECVNVNEKPEDWVVRLGEHSRMVLERYDETIKVNNNIEDKITEC